MELYQEAPKGYVLRPVKYGPYSPSRLIVGRCPARFFGQYIRKDRAIAATVNAARGSAIHQVFSKITEARLQSINLTPGMVSNWIQSAVAAFPAAYEQVDLIRRASDAYISNPSPHLTDETYCEHPLAIQFWEQDTFVDDAILGKAYVEVPYKDERGWMNQAAFFGGQSDLVSIDHIARVVVITDHKTTPNASKNPDHVFQMGCYAWLYSKKYPGYQIKTVIHYAHPDLNFYGRPEYWSADDLANIESNIHDHIWALENMSEFPAQPGDSCDYCHMVQECPVALALHEQRARGTIDLNYTTRDDLIRLAEQLNVLDALRDQVTRSLKKGLEMHAPVGGVDLGGGTWYGFKTSDEATDWTCTELKVKEESQKAQRILQEREDIPPDERKKLELWAKFTNLAAIFKHYELDPQAFKEFKSDRMKQIWRLDKPALLDTLRAFVVNTRSTRWGKHKR